MLGPSVRINFKKNTASHPGINSVTNINEEKGARKTTMVKFEDAALDDEEELGLANSKRRRVA